MTEQELRCSSALTPGGWVSPALLRVDSSGRIAAVEALPMDAATEYGPILPGMPNLHSHAFQRLMAGLGNQSSAGGELLPGGDPLPGGDSFWTWRELMYRLALRIQPGQLLAIAACLQAEMLEHGYTSCAEFHYLHHQPDGRPYDDPAEMSVQLVEAAELSGIALTLLPVLYCRSGFASNETNEHQRRFRNSLDEYLDLWSRCRGLRHSSALRQVGMAPHSLRAVAPDQLAALLQSSHGVAQPIHIHVAEQLREVEECQRVLGARPVQWLLREHPVDQRWCLVHATHVDTAEISGMLNTGAVIGLCPSTEGDLGDGYFGIEHWFRQGGHFGIGSDSNLRLCPAEELRMLEFQARLHSGRRNVLTRNGMSSGRSLFEHALAGGSRAMGQQTGQLAAGFHADLIELDAGHLLLQGRRDDSLLDTWILAGDRSMIRRVWVGGELRVVEGRHVARESLQAAYRKTMRALL
jgi:formimidoylglutamate deiminase